MGLFNQLFKHKPPHGEEKTGDRAKPPPAETAVASPIVPPPDPSAFLHPKAYVPRGGGASAHPASRPGIPARPSERKANPSGAAAPGEIILTLGDVLSRIPTQVLKEGAHDPKRELRFQICDLSSDIARGRAVVPLSCIAALCPDIFVREISPVEDMEVRLPLQKLVEQVGLLRSTPAPPRESAASSPSTASPVAKSGIPVPGAEARPAAQALQPATMELKSAEAHSPPPDAVELRPHLLAPVEMETAGLEISATEAKDTPPAAAKRPDHPPTTSETEPATKQTQPASGREAGTTGLQKIRLSLAAIIKDCPREIIVGTLPPISETVRIELPFSLIESQLTWGTVELTSLRFITALPHEYMKYFVVKDEVKVPIPLDEIFANLPGFGDGAEGAGDAETTSNEQKKTGDEPAPSAQPETTASQFPFERDTSEVSQPGSWMEIVEAKAPPQAQPEGLPAKEAEYEASFAEPHTSESPKTAEGARVPPEPVAGSQEAASTTEAPSPAGIETPPSEDAAAVAAETNKDSSPAAKAEELAGLSGPHGSIAASEPHVLSIPAFRIFVPRPPSVTASPGAPPFIPAKPVEPERAVELPAISEPHPVESELAEGEDSVGSLDTLEELLPKEAAIASPALAETAEVEAASLAAAPSKVETPLESGSAVEAGIPSVEKDEVVAHEASSESKPGAPSEDAVQLAAMAGDLHVLESEIPTAVHPALRPPLLHAAPEAKSVPLIELQPPPSPDSPSDGEPHRVEPEPTTLIHPPAKIRPLVLAPPPIFGFPPESEFHEVVSPEEASGVSTSASGASKLPEADRLPTTSVPETRAADPPLGEDAGGLASEAGPPISEIVLLASGPDPAEGSLNEGAETPPTAAQAGGVGEERGADGDHASDGRDEAGEPPIPAALPNPLSIPKAAAFEHQTTPKSEPVVSPAEPSPVPPPLPLSRFDQGFFQMLFLTDEVLDLPGICRHAAGLPGVQACAIRRRGEKVQAGAMPDGFDFSALLRLAPEVREVARRLPIGGLKHFTLYAEKHSVTFFERSGFRLCAVHRPSSFIPGVREKLVAIADELSKLV